MVVLLPRDRSSIPLVLTQPQYKCKHRLIVLEYLKYKCCSKFTEKVHSVPSTHYPNMHMCRVRGLWAVPWWAVRWSRRRHRSLRVRSQRAKAEQPSPYLPEMWFLRRAARRAPAQTWRDSLRRRLFLYFLPQPRIRTITRIYVRNMFTPAQRGAALRLRTISRVPYQNGKTGTCTKERVPIKLPYDWFLHIHVNLKYIYIYHRAQNVEAPMSAYLYVTAVLFEIRHTYPTLYIPGQQKRKYLIFCGISDETHWAKVWKWSNQIRWRT